MFATIEASAPAAFTLQDAQQLLYREARAQDDRDWDARARCRVLGTVLGRQLVCTDAKCEGVRGSVNLIARLGSGTPEVRPQLRLLQNSVNGITGGVSCVM